MAELFDWDNFRKYKLAVHCDTKEKADNFLKMCHEQGLRWSSGAMLLNCTWWCAYKKYTCYVCDFCGVYYTGLDEAEECGYEIVEWSHMVN